MPYVFIDGTKINFPSMQRCCSSCVYEEDMMIFDDDPCCCIHAMEWFTLDEKIISEIKSNNGQNNNTCS